MGLMGNLIGVKREQIRARILSIEQSMSLQKQLNAVYSLGKARCIPPDQPSSGAYGLWPWGNQSMHTSYPDNAYSILHQGTPAAPLRLPNMNIPPPIAAPATYGLNNPNYIPPQLSQALNVGFPCPYGPNTSVFILHKCHMHSQ